MATNKIRNACVDAKHSLSKNEQVNINIETLANLIDFEMSINREDFS